MVRAVLGREVAVLVERCAVAALMHGAAEVHRQTVLIVELRNRRDAGESHDENRQCFRGVVRLSRATGDVDDRKSRSRGPAPAEVVAHAHGAGRVVLHGRDAAIRGARSQRDNRRCLRSQPVDPLVRGDRLSVRGVDSHACEVALAVDLLVRQRSLDDEDERIELAGLCVIPGLHELGTVLIREHRGMRDHLRHTGDCARDDVLEGRVDCRRHGNRVTIAAQTRRHPDDVSGDVLRLVLPWCELD